MYCCEGRFGTPLVLATISTRYPASYAGVIHVLVAVKCCEGRFGNPLFQSTILEARLRVMWLINLFVAMEAFSVLRFCLVELSGPNVQEVPPYMQDPLS